MMLVQLRFEKENKTLHDYYDHMNISDGSSLTLSLNLFLTSQPKFLKWDIWIQIKKILLSKVTYGAFELYV